jgi:hypothetical protein
MIKSLKWIRTGRLYARISFPSQQERKKIRNFRDQGSSNEIQLSALTLVAVLRTPNTIYFPITSDIKHTQNRSDAHV